jgi:hypothetical protein
MGLDGRKPQGRQRPRRSRQESRADNLLLDSLQMRYLTRLLVVFLPFTSLAWAGGTPWQYGRIATVKRSVTTRTKAWVVNTPIGEDETTYTISVHLLDKLIVGTYDSSPEQGDPPMEWTANYPLPVRVEGDAMYLRAPASTLRLHIVQRKDARPMVPLTDDERKRLQELDAPSDSLIGFSGTGNQKSENRATAQVPPPAPPPPEPTTTGTVTVRSTPYLSEVFVDGDSMGYTPAKISLPPGKHIFRVEKAGYKPWSKEMTITIGSELNLEASLDKK